MTKTVLLNLKIREDARDDFRIVAELRGSTMSNLLHQYIYKLIREEKERSPQSFVDYDGEKVAAKSNSKIKLKTENDDVREKKKSA